MSTDNRDGETEFEDLHSDAAWSALYPALRGLARYLINTYPLPCWRGQESDIVEDVVQETMRKLLERANKAELGTATPIQSLRNLMSVVAYNHCRDMKRRDHRLSRLESCELPDEELRQRGTGDAHHMLDFVAEKVDQEELFVQIAGEVGHFPRKQKAALLTDLANLMSFDSQATPLQAAFEGVGIQLQEYQHPLPADAKERSRHISLLSQAYKRISQLSCAQREE